MKKDRLYVRYPYRTVKEGKEEWRKHLQQKKEPLAQGKGSRYGFCISGSGDYLLERGAEFMTTTEPVLELTVRDVFQQEIAAWD